MNKKAKEFIKKRNERFATGNPIKQKSKTKNEADEK